MQTFPTSQQPVDAATCGPFCLQNIYEYFGLNIQVKDILKEIYSGEKDGTYLTQLARHLHKNHLDTTLFTANSYAFSPKWKDFAAEKIIEELKHWITTNYDNNYALIALHNLFYLQEGGQVKITNLSVALFDKLLNSDHILLCLVEESWLWEKRKILNKPEYDNVRGNARGHYVVAYGIDKSNYLVSDPYPTKISNKEKNYAINKDQLLNAVFLRGASILAIKKQKPKSE